MAANAHVNNILQEGNVLHSEVSSLLCTWSGSWTVARIYKFDDGTENADEVMSHGRHMMRLLKVLTGYTKVQNSTYPCFNKGWQPIDFLLGECEASNIDRLPL